MAPQNVLLVEGRDDLMVVCNLLQKSGVPETFKVEDKGGIENILRILPVQIKGSETSRIGVMVDADVNLAARWQQITDTLKKSGYANIPANPDPNGSLILSDGRPIIGIWLMPDNEVPGILEHFVSQLIPEKDQLAEYANETIAALPRKLFKDEDTKKAYIHTWLAWQSDPGTPMGLAITKKYLDSNAAGAVKFIGWIQRLFA